jgi:hypothetical protein
MADAAPAVAGWTADIEAVRAIAPAAVEGEGGQVKITREELLMLKRAAEEGAGLASEKRKREDNTFDSGRWEQMLEEHQDATMAKIEKQKKEIKLRIRLPPAQRGYNLIQLLLYPPRDYYMFSGP